MSNGNEEIVSVRATFWHHIAEVDQRWWEFLVTNGQIATGFDNRQGDEGERILRRYVAGDRVVGYAKGFGAVGWGEIEDPDSYRLLPLGHEHDLLHGHNRHRLNVRWRAVAPKLTRAVEPKEISRRFGIFHPLSTSQRIESGDPKALVEHLSMLFGTR